MKLNKYSITVETLEEVLGTLSDYAFSPDGEYTNNDVIEAKRMLEGEMRVQENLELAKED